MAIEFRKTEAPVTFEIHPAANIFPEMTDDEAKSLMIDIRENGQREPIILFNGKVIDGRNRLRACRWLGFEPKTREYQGREDEIVSYVLSLNLHRRHLTEGQRAMIASNLATMKQGARTDLSPIGGMSQSEAAKALSVGKRSVERAVQVSAKAEPEVVAAVTSGEMSLNEASKVVQLRPEIQRSVASMPKQERRETLAGNTIEQLGIIGSRDDEHAADRQALCRIIAELANLKGTPDQLIASMPKFLAPKLNQHFRQASMKMQAMNAVYQNWEFRNVHND